MINLPKTTEEAILKIITDHPNLSLQDRNFLEREADKIGLDYDKDLPDQFKPTE
jgi:hypothetical protein